MNHKKVNVNSIQLFLSNLSFQKIVIIFTVLGFLLYFKALTNKFVWDDNIYIIGNPKIQTIDLKVLFGPNNIFNDVSYYRPLSATYFAFVYSLSKNSPFLYHFLQIILHIVNTSLIYLLFKKFFDKNASFYLALLFLVHPINVESVAFIGATQSPLLFLLGISALLLSMKPIPTSRNIFVISFLLLLSMLTKEVGFLFILLVLLFQRLFNRDQLKNFLVPSFIVVAFYLLIRLIVGQSGMAATIFVPIGRISFWERLINIPLVILYYLKTLIFPKNLAIDQLWHITFPTINNFYLPLLADLIFFGLIVMLGFRIHKNEKQFSSYILFLSWFLIGTGMLLQIFPLDMTVADRWFYFPMVGLLGLAGLFVTTLIPKTLFQNKFFSLSIVTIFILFSVRTYIRIDDWKDPVTLYKHDIKVENNYDLESNLGFELAVQGNYKEAFDHFDKSISMNPYEFNLRNMGSLYATLGDIEKAKEYYGKALHSTSYVHNGKHYFEITYTTYAELLLYAFNNHNDTVEAKNTLQKALSDYPLSEELWKLLALTNYRLEEKNEARVNILKAVNLRPDPVYIYIQKQIDSDLPVVLSIQKPSAPTEKPEVVFQPTNQ